jgi:hypothetical protein
MAHVTLDGKPLEVADGITILQAAREAGVEIPALCARDGCLPQTSCLVCVVRVNGAARLVPACVTPVAEGMSIESESEGVMDARRTALELLLSDHAGDCLAPCQMACPAGMDIPQMLRLITENRLDDAVAVVKRRIPLPAVLGRICPAPCENPCRRHELDAAVCIKDLKRLVGDRDLRQERPYQPLIPPTSGESIAVVGAGPTGLSAAYYLRRMGHAVTLLDDREQPGGMMRTGPAPEVLPAEVLDREIALLLEVGIALHSGVALGREITLEQLRTAHDAVLLACGPLPPEQLEAWGLALAKHGVQVDHDSLQTSQPGVFAAGGVLTPMRLAVRAMAQGWAVAHSIDQYVRSRTPAVPPRPFTTRPGKLHAHELTEMKASADGAERAGAALDDMETARAQAARCLSCACKAADTCRLRHWAAVYHAHPSAYCANTHGHAWRRSSQPETSHELVTYDSGKCISCGLCVQIARREEEPLGLTYIGRGFQVRIGVPWDEKLSEGLCRAARECAAACPTGAIAVRS